jgi:hypothetical protein
MINAAARCQSRRIQAANAIGERASNTGPFRVHHLEPFYPPGVDEFASISADLRKMCRDARG